MRRFSKLAIVPVCASILISCGGGEDMPETTDPETTPPVEQTCTYRYDHVSTGVYWTAYKFTDKAGVKGKFDVTGVLGAGMGENPEDVIMGATMQISTESVNSDNPDRDKKIFEHFFTTANTTQIVGKINSAADGKGMVLITMNEIEKEVEFTYAMEENVLKLNMDINVEDWDAGNGITALNEVCKELHTGTDGESVLWPEVSIMLETTLTKDCK